MSKLTQHKLTITIDRFDITTKKLDEEQSQEVPHMWDVAFTVSIEGGEDNFIPVTVFAHELNNPTNEQAMRLAVMRSIPQQFSKLFTEPTKNEFSAFLEAESANNV